MTLPLEGLCIVAAEHWAAGPYATDYLADLGADVIKIENTSQGGDACRTLGPYYLGEEDSHVFQSFNRNKRPSSSRARSGSTNPCRTDRGRGLGRTPTTYWRNSATRLARSPNCAIPAWCSAFCLV